MKRAFMLAGMGVIAANFITACGGSGGSSGGGTAADRVAPTVSYTAPLHNDTAVGLNSAVSVTFSETMDPSSVTAATLVVTVAGTTIPATAITYDSGSKIATYSLQTDLAPNTEYSATVTTAVKDLAGNPMSASYAWKFITGALPDTTPPAATSATPADGQTNVATNAAVAISLSEAMNPLSVISGFRVSEGSSPVSGTVVYLGTTIAFTPAGDLKPDTWYTATLTTEAKDLAGNPLTTDHSWTFRTGASQDRTAPTVLSATPSLGATNVPVESPITVRFNEPLFPFFFGKIDGIPARITFDYSTNTATVTPTQNFKNNAIYNATAQPWDMAGNRMLPFTWSFATAP